ncbi:MAG: oligosaccharide flippase family protein [Bacteroidota bacterium]
MTKKIVYNMIATMINVLSGFLRNKIFAAFLTLNLFGILSISQQMAGVLFPIFAFGLPLGITTLSSQLITASTDEKRETLSRVIMLSMMLAGIFLGILLLVILWNPDYVCRLVTNRTDFALPVSLLLLSAPFTVIQSCLYAIMEGAGMLKEILIFKILPAIIILPILYFLSASYHLTGAAMGLMGNEIFLTVIGLIILRKSYLLNMKALNVSPIFVKIFKVALLSFIVGVTWLIGDFLVKRYILGKLGEVDNAIVQSVAKVADLYPNIALAWLTMHIFPEIAKRRNDPQGTVSLIERTTLIAIAIIVPIIIVLFLGRSLVLEFIYKKEFTIATGYFGAMLVTGIPKVYSWVLGVALLPLGFRKDWFYSTMIFTSFYVFGSWIGFTNHLSIYLLPVVLSLGFILQSGITINIYHRRGISFSGSFIHQSFLYALMIVLLVISVYWLPGIIGVTIVYCYLNYRYGVFQDMLGKLYAFAN